MEDITLSAEQSSALSRIIKGSSPVSILTGGAGVGKSTIIRALLETGRCAVCATTGRAAVNVGGVTVDRLFSLNRDNWTIRREELLRYNMSAVPDLIIIDEASMVGRKMANLLADIRQAFRKRFVLVGDWAQASPVKDEWIIGSELLQEVEVIRLTENHRQADGEYLSALNELRHGRVTDEIRRLFEGRVRSLKAEDATNDVRMYATNAKAENYNRYRFWRHVSERGLSVTHATSVFADQRPATTQSKYPRDERAINSALESSPTAHDLPLSVDCRVMITANLPEADLVNGDTGTVMDIVLQSGTKLSEALPGGDEPSPPIALQVLCDRTKQLHMVGNYVCEFRDVRQNLEHAVTGLPVRLGYAMTIHKSQGSTVQSAYVDMRSINAFPDRESKHGLAYVALSRTRTLEGLTLSGWSDEAVYCSPTVADFI